MTGPTEQTGCGEIPNTRLAGIGHTDVAGDSPIMPWCGIIHTPRAAGQIGTGPRSSLGVGHMDLTGVGSMPGFGESSMPGAYGEMGMGTRLCAGIIPTIPVIRCGVIETPPCLGDMHAGISHTPLLDMPGRGEASMPGFGNIPIIPVRRFSVIEMPPAVGEPGMPPAIGDIPIGPVRSCGDIYATAPTFGNMYAGLRARQLYTGADRRLGEMEIT